ncbi:hypothetical protein BDY19DRAFT_764070 [Irpex rosettiformis]|uniref:Uncharacterized protein n=1 Tax=Irpex rosettiformis TaxID=378272 RepID=A0ACB8U7M1_9APHY|nr:hypothetical protein BDY19DRAFT_764070 [Irpex rosettiformis]
MCQSTGDRHPMHPLRLHRPEHHPLLLRTPLPGVTIHPPRHRVEGSLPRRSPIIISSIREVCAFLSVVCVPNSMLIHCLLIASPDHHHIPQSSSIPSITNANNIPFVYSISDLLSLSSSPAPLSSSQQQSFAEVVTLLSLPINNDKAALRRRRNGRRNNSSKAAKDVKDVPVEVRRTRHGHGTWGWQAQHQHEVEVLQVPWRHEQSTPIAVVA